MKISEAVVPHSRAGTRSPFLRSLLDGPPDVTATVARLALGVTILPHGAQKLLGWFGGYGFTGTMNWFTESVHVPWFLAFGVILAETLGGFALLAGAGSRFAGASLAVIYVAAAALVHAPHGFFMNWFGNQSGEGIEYFILGIALSFVVVWRGGGALSVDRAIMRRWHAPGA